MERGIVAGASRAQTTKKENAISAFHREILPIGEMAAEQETVRTSRRGKFCFPDGALFEGEFSEVVVVREGEESEGVRRQGRGGEESLLVAGGAARQAMKEPENQLNKDNGYGPGEEGQETELPEE